jgi:hypothetical protein
VAPAGHAAHLVLLGNRYRLSRPIPILRFNCNQPTDQPTNHKSEPLAGSVDDAGGMYFVPAFTGLLAPHWRSDARGYSSLDTHTHTHTPHPHTHYRTRTTAHDDWWLVNNGSGWRWG